MGFVIVREFSVREMDLHGARFGVERGIVVVPSDEDQDGSTSWNAVVPAIGSRAPLRLHIARASMETMNATPKISISRRCSEGHVIGSGVAKDGDSVNHEARRARSLCQGGPSANGLGSHNGPFC